MSIYTALLRPLLFRLDAERAHHLAIRVCEGVGRMPLAASVSRLVFGTSPPRLRTALAGLTLDSPIALGAGFDKNGRAMAVLSTLGYGAIEIGAVSSRPCAGNSGCRAVRLVQERSVVTRYGVPNEGVARILPRFTRLARQGRRVPVGINIIWNSTHRPDSPIEDIVQELAATLQAFSGVVDYATLNFACPNIHGEGHFDDIANVRLLFEAVDATRPTVPVFLKFRHRPDPGWRMDLLALSGRYPWVKGFIPIVHMMRTMGAPSDDGPALKGSVSGALIRDATLDMVRLWSQEMDPTRHALIATGGLSSAADVFEAMAAGATAVQLFTAMVYQGPGAVSRMNRELNELMQAAGIDSTSRLIGSACPLPRAVGNAAQALNPR